MQLATNLVPVEDFTVYSFSNGGQICHWSLSWQTFWATAVQVHKKLSNQTRHVVTDNPRLTAARCQLKADSDIIIGSV